MENEVALKSKTMKKITEMLKALTEKKMVFKNKTGLIIAFILILLIVGFVTFNYVRHSEKKEVTVNQTETIPVQVAEARLTNLQRVLELTGEIKPAAAVNVYPKIGGEIIEKIDA
ncbi:hypothetical protein HX99_04730 [Peptococcaceae bacterium SCADC1_2_3]|nr:hypothetical protein DK28_0201575 [Peptococcaceae bacterium SCADC1_2_3]KFI37004.1 hypothetical protein HX99_04730 [Peptococcaceae bacterium SCADC1_2_3]KFI37301.1 hypothetical protein HY02_08490 [Peptococcaceae bacterium SCADC1_2_3]